MADIAGSISSLVPDQDVPAERVQTATVSRRAERRQARFLRGPIPLEWVRKNIRDSADRLLLVMLAHADMQRTTELKVSADILRDAGIAGRKVEYRALSVLEERGVLSVSRRSGRRPRVQLKDKPR